MSAAAAVTLSPTALEGRAALVTGAGRPDGIGAAVAWHLALAGAAVAVADLPDDVETGRHDLAGVVSYLRDQGLTATALVGDVGDEDDVAALVQDCHGALGSCDILVNNAAAVQGADRADVAAVPVAAFDEQVRVNLRGAFLLSRAAVPGMRERRWGRIVNVGSIVATAAVRHRTAYSASKAGLLGLTRALAADVAGDGITANAVCPGLILTSRNVERPDDGPWQRARALYDRAPVGRPGHPDDVAGVVAFFASDLASYVTGESLLVDGGLGVALVPT